MVSWKVQTIFPIWSCLLFLCVSCEKKRVVYTGYEAHRFTPATHDDVKTLKTLEKNDHGLIFLRRSGTVGQPVDILFAPHLTDILNSLKNKMSSKLLSNDIEKQLDHENTVRTLEAMGENEFSFENYWDFFKYRSFMQNLANTHPEICQIKQYGTSSGPAQLPLEVMEVGLKEPSSLKKPTLFIDGGTHSREWITIMACCHFMNDVVTNSEKYSAIMNVFNFAFVCCVNPEGFSYSWDVNRFWRKTRTPTSNLACPGVDPNRNYDFGFGGGGTSPDECSDVYHGPGPFSISETRDLSNYTLSKDCRSYTSLHSYSQLILLGYGCRSGKVPNQIYPTFQNDKTVATFAADALKSVNGTSYTADNSDLILYEACGTSQDWQLTHVDYAWTYELRDTGTFGFVLPASQIEPSCRETTASLDVLHHIMAQQILDRNMARKDNGQVTDEEKK